ncbi:hypothetical protein J6590_076958 [Homalodisca vitripennis]|nr:hypothetical protein J6590_076958 [Homalodisca vitripennis]
MGNSYIPVATLRLYRHILVRSQHTKLSVLGGVRACNVQFSVECERVVSPYIHRPRGLQAGRTDATRCRERFTSLLVNRSDNSNYINHNRQSVWAPQ